MVRACVSFVLYQRELYNSTTTSKNFSNIKHHLTTNLINEKTTHTQGIPSDEQILVYFINMEQVIMAKVSLQRKHSIDVMAD